MYVCICNAVTDKEIRQAAKAGTTSLSALQEELGVAMNCGSCADDAAAILRQARSGKPALSYPKPILYRPTTA
ncbi:MAG: (2Fe-2S)-binding protein [Pseudomonadota bacterium]